MKSAFDKHGVENFEFSVICEIPTEELNAREILEIRERNTLYPNGYNLESGGNTNVITHPETLRKMSEAQKGKKASEETRKKLSDARKGENNHMFGKNHTEETRKKLSDARKGENHHMFGKTHTEETLRKMSEARKGKKMTEEAIAKRSEARWKSVRQLSLDGDLIAVFDSMIQAGESLGSDYSGISKCCRGKLKTYKDFKWEYSITL
jgi:group I intron endonuclease